MHQIPSPYRLKLSYLQPMKWLTIALFTIMISEGICQGNAKFENSPLNDRQTLQATPVGGYKQLLRYLQTEVSDGDTIGKKYSLQLYNVRFRVSEKGTIDSVYVGINHDACPMHNAIAEKLKNTMWMPARDKGIQVKSEQTLHGQLYFNKRVQKKYNCWPSFLMRLIF